MSGTVNLTSLFTNLTSTSTTPNLFAIIAGQGSTSSTTNPITALQQAEANQTKDIAATEKQTSVQMAITAFTKAVTSAKSVTQLLSNPAFQQVFLTANNLASNIGYTALVTKALMSNPNDSKSLANTLSDTNWKSTVSAYNFYANGLSAIQSSSAIASLTEAYAEVTWRNSLDTTTPGLSNALTFRSEASTITSVDQILGDPVMRDVVTTTLGLPEQIAVQPLEAQETAISSRLDIKNFKTPQYVDQFVDQYLIAKGQASTSTTSTTNMFQLAGEASGLTV